MTAPLRVTMKLSNNRLIRAREDLGMSPRELSEQEGMVSYGMLLQYESMKVSPVGADGYWKPSALALARFHGFSPEYLWPKALLEIKKTTEFRETEIPTDPVLESEVERRSLHQAVREQVRALSAIEQRALHLRFTEDKTREEVGKAVSTTGKCARSIEEGALRKLRHPRLSARLRYGWESSS